MAWGWDQREPAERLVGARARGPGAGAWWLARLGELWVALETTLVEVRESSPELFLGCSAEKRASFSEGS